MDEIPSDIAFDDSPSEGIAANSIDAVFDFRNETLSEFRINAKVVVNGLGVIPPDQRGIRSSLPQKGAGML